MASHISGDLLCPSPYTSNPQLSVQFMAIQVHPGKSAAALGDIASNEDLVRKTNVTFPVYRHDSRGNETNSSRWGVGRQPFARCVARRPWRVPRVVNCELILQIERLAIKSTHGIGFRRNKFPGDFVDGVLCRGSISSQIIQSVPPCDIVTCGEIGFTDEIT